MRLFLTEDIGSIQRGDGVLLALLPARTGHGGGDSQGRVDQGAVLILQADDAIDNLPAKA